MVDVLSINRLGFYPIHQSSFKVLCKYLIIEPINIFPGTGDLGKSGVTRLMCTPDIFDKIEMVLALRMEPALFFVIP
jgi:hypothetical protein